MSKVTLIDGTIHPEEVIANAASICQQSATDSVSNANRLRSMLKHGHYSVLGFANATFKVEDISLITSVHLIRIAHSRILQKSYRTCGIDYKITLEDQFHQYDFMVNPVTGQLYDDVIESLMASYKSYLCSLKRGTHQENARYILPTGMATALNMSGNFQMWRHFLKLRLSKHAQWEIREVAEKIQQQLAVIAPTIFGIDNIVA